MNASDIFEETFSALTVNKMRTGLTMLGIIIGIASVIAMVAIGQGSQNSIEARINAIGANLILISPGAQRTPGSPVSAGRGSAETLTLDDANAIASQISMAKAVDPELSKRYQVTAGGQNTNTTIDGVTATYPEVRNLQMASGSFISDDNVTELSKVAVLGPTTAADLFGANVDPTGQSIRIDNMNFQVIGMAQSKGGTGFGNQDDMIYIPISVMQRELAGATTLSGGYYVSAIDVEADSQKDMTAAQNAITALLLQQHNLSDPTQADFTIQNQQSIVQTASATTDTFTILLASIAGISLVVGGIGIMNMMLTTVTERTREIGLRKAIGADKKDISMQFLAESFALTLVGGIIGILLGWLVSIGVTTFFGIVTQISILSIFVAFGVSAVIGIIFGYYPARRAAGLNPIEALRYE